MCDPLKNGEISRTEELLPYLVMDVLGDFPGLPGLFVASIYSAALRYLPSQEKNKIRLCILSCFLKYDISGHEFFSCCLHYGFYTTLL